MKKSNSVNPEIELIAVVKDSRAYVVFYILKDNVKRVIWAVKPKGFYYFINFSHHIHWLDKPRLNEEVMIIDNLRAYIEYGRVYLESINGNTKIISLGLYRRLEKTYAARIKSYYISFPTTSIDDILVEIQKYTPRSQGINKKSIGVTRPKAKLIIDDIVNIAKEINTDPSSLYRISLLGVFGSYVNSSKDKLGDIDIFYTIIPKDGITREMILAANKELMTQSDRSDYFLQVMAEAHKSEWLTLRRLKHNHVSVSLHNYEEHKEMLETEKYKILFTE
ncbi:hypothetical protein [Caproiciproducens sp.]|uniref:hypothetical protein n=1 Tax=Caproiciproducens sp. TaxID=1954376 RepID=UPI00289ABF4B|nr:hypothetical protein [Caproiciproducens sp.]